MSLGPVAPAPAALNWHTAKLSYETDCSDVATALREDPGSLTVLDVRSPDAYAGGHVPGAVSLPHSTISAETVAALPSDTTVVVYCWGPHCNGADKGAAALAHHGVSAKVMIGGIWGWEQEGESLAVDQR